MLPPPTQSESIRFLQTVQQDDSQNEKSNFHDLLPLLFLWGFLACWLVKAQIAHQCAQRLEAASVDQSHQQIAQQQQQQQANLNVGLILSNLHLHLRPGMVMDGEEEARAERGGPADVMNGEEAGAAAERTKRITMALQITTFTVGENDVIEQTDGNETKSSITADEELGASALNHETIMDHSHLALPSDAPHGSRTVPGECAICLCHYAPGDIVTWSNEDACQHAFHSECIVGWLAKENKAKCPCCRQDYYCIVLGRTDPVL